MLHFPHLRITLAHQLEVAVGFDGDVVGGD